MAIVTGKRKREAVSAPAVPAKKAAVAVNGASKKVHSGTTTKAASSSIPHSDSNGHTSASTGPLHVQVVTGSYERVLHGISVQIPPSALDTAESKPEKTEKTPQAARDDISFSDSFLFAAHSSAIRCLTVSPPTEEASKRYLATGSSDERINVYSLSTAPPPPSSINKLLPSLAGTATAENPRNRSLGSLVHHDRAITRLQFPTKSKLFSAAEDATIAISRTRDWTVLSSIKAPIPKPLGRPSGDTAGPGEIPAGVNDFAIHPSQKLMLSVGRGERCMRLWNLMTGKKAGVLNFDRALLTQVGEGKFGSGEGRRVLWDEEGENYVVEFERGAALFGIDSKPKAIIKPSPLSKIHQMQFLPSDRLEGSILAISTEDGRVCLFDVNASGVDQDAALPGIPCVAYFGGRAGDISGRVKDFSILKISAAGEGEERWLFVTGSSDGAIRLWTVSQSEVEASRADESPKQIGNLIATHETVNRITCLGAFVLDGKVSEESEDVERLAGAAEVEEEDDDDSEGSDEE